MFEYFFPTVTSNLIDQREASVDVFNQTFFLAQS